MAIDFKKTQLSGHTPEIWRGECKILPGGFKPVQNFPVGTVLHRGTPIYVRRLQDRQGSQRRHDHRAPRRQRALLRRRRRSNETRSNRQIPDHQVHRHGQCRVRCHHVRIRHRRAGRGRHPRRGSRICYTPNMVVGAAKEFTGKGLPTIDAAYEAVVLYPSLNFPLLEDWLINPGKVCLKANPNILFIKQ